MSHRGVRANRKAVEIRFIDDPKVTARFQIQEHSDHEQWTTLRMFSNEAEARSYWTYVKEYGLGVRVLDTAKIQIEEETP